MMAIGERKAGPQADVATLAIQPKKHRFSGVCYRNGMMGSRAWASAYAGAKAWPSDVQGSKPNLSAACARLKASRDAARYLIISLRSPKVARMSTRTSGACAKSITTKLPGKSSGIETGQSSERTGGRSNFLSRIQVA